MKRKVSIHHIDVGQGDATLIMITDTSDQNVRTIHKSILIDIGESADTATTVANFCRYKLDRTTPTAMLDYVIFTHY